MNDRLRIGFLTPWDIHDPRSWSGIVAPMFVALSEAADVVPISTKDVPTAFLDRGLARLVGAATSKTYLWDFGVATARARGSVAAQRIGAAEVDVVFAVAASVDVAFLAATTPPVVQYVDATFGAMQEQYPVFTGVHPLSVAQIRFLGSRAGRHTSRYVAASQWAVDALARDAVGTELCTVAPPGAAIAPVATRAEWAEGPLRALVVASDWRRKGGDRAVAAVEAARSRGADVELRVVGDAPELPSWAVPVGRLEAAELSAEYLNADVLLELARANAAGVTLTDAAVHGLPAIATRVGGVPSIVADGRSGWLVDPATDPVGHAADRLVALCADRGESATMSPAARAWYAEELDWAVWSARVVAACESAARDRKEGVG